MNETTVLVTGGTGFIGSHTCLDLLQHGYHVVMLDNLSNSFAAVPQRVQQLSSGQLDFCFGDVRDRGCLDELFGTYDISAIVHFAAFKAVGESVVRPLEYYDNNVTGLVSLLTAARTHGIQRIVFSSSCSIYGAADTVPITEDAPIRPTNPYAQTKAMCERILDDTCQQHPSWSVVSLRYFNPIGAHESGLLGEDPRGVPNNLIPYLAQVAVGRLPYVEIFGSDYPTVDGTGVRDYIHVADLAAGHRFALELSEHVLGFRCYNLGTGSGTSVLQLIESFGKACGRDLPYRIGPRRPGDVATLVAAPERARLDLRWAATRDIDAMCADAWRFQEANPWGYEPSQQVAAGATADARRLTSSA